MADLGKVGLVLKGSWNNAATYEVLDVVTYNNGLYIAKQDVPANTLPTDTTYWQVGFDSSIIGSTNISNIADGTLTGAVSVMSYKGINNAIDITSYNTSGNRYTFPSDGYLNIGSGNNSSGSVKVPIYGGNNVGGPAVYMNITGADQAQSIYVRKGMKCFVYQMTTGCTVTFSPLFAG